MKSKKWDLSRFPIAQIKPAPENVDVYDDFGISNLDDFDLTVSIRDDGIKEPLTLSSDHFLLSGHRRLAAAKVLEMKTVPVRIVDVNFSSLSRPERVRVLRMHNQQRDKSPQERIRERIVATDPEWAWLKLLQQRIIASKAPEESESNVDMGRVKVRATITTIQFLEAVQRVVEEHKQYWPLTVRRYHYLLLTSNPPLRHDKKPGSRYANDKASYKALTGLLVRARLAGLVPMSAVEDSTRPIQLGGGSPNLEYFIEQEMKYFLGGYVRNVMQGQVVHVEIMLEKNALRSVIEPVAKEFCIPMTTGRGFSSLSPRAAIAARFKNSGKRRLVLLMLTDFDPDGEQIASSFAQSLRDDFGIPDRDIHAVKVALTKEDIETYNLPADMDAKPSSPNYKKFFAKHGSKAVELDAAPVEVLQTKLREAIVRVIDVDAFNAQVELEKTDAAHVEAHRQVVLEAIGRVS